MKFINFETNDGDILVNIDRIVTITENKNKRIDDDSNTFHVVVLLDNGETIKFMEYGTLMSFWKYLNEEYSNEKIVSSLRTVMEHR